MYCFQFLCSDIFNGFGQGIKFERFVSVEEVSISKDGVGFMELRVVQSIKFGIGNGFFKVFFVDSVVGDVFEGFGSFECSFVDGCGSVRDLDCEKIGVGVGGVGGSDLEVGEISSGFIEEVEVRVLFDGRFFVEQSGEDGDFGFCVVVIGVRESDGDGVFDGGVLVLFIIEVFGSFGFDGLVVLSGYRYVFEEVFNLRREGRGVGVVINDGEVGVGVGGISESCNMVIVQVFFVRGG